MQRLTASYLQTTVFGLRIDGDIVFDGKTYKRFYRDTISVERKLIDADPENVAESLPQYEYREGGGTALNEECLREEGRKIFIYWPPRGTELLLYDFSLAEGESTSGDYAGGSDLSVDKIETIVAQGQEFRRFVLSSPDRKNLFWIEGVGHPCGPFRAYGNEVSDGREYTLLSVYEDGECVFFKDDFNVQESAVSFLVEGKTWYYGDYYYIVKGDTTINDVPCKKIYKNGEDYMAALYEEGKRVMCFLPGQADNAWMLYDFGLEEGDVFTPFNNGYDFNYQAVVIHVDTIYIDGVPYRRLASALCYPDTDLDTTGFWLEGVGSWLDLFIPFVTGIRDSIPVLSDCKIGDERIGTYFADASYKNLIWGKIANYFDDCLGVEAVADTQENNNSTIFDLQGRRLKTAPEKGVYIRGGKKFIRK